MFGNQSYNYTHPKATRAICEPDRNELVHMNRERSVLAELDNSVPRTLCLSVVSLPTP